MPDRAKRVSLPISLKVELSECAADTGQPRISNGLDRYFLTPRKNGSKVLMTDTIRFPKSAVPVYLRVRGDEMYGNFQWGIIPDWAKSKSNILINTKSEEVLNKPTWIESFKRRRCLLPATSFFEPANVDGKKYQMEFSLKDGSPFAFAGIWQKTEMFGDKLNCCSILTCRPNRVVGEVHERMPVVLKPEQFEDYLDPPPEHIERVIALLRPLPDDLMHGSFEDAS